MLVMPNPEADRSRAIPRPSSATDNRKPIDRTVDARNRDAAGARMAHGVGQGLLGDAHDLAFHAGAEARQFFEGNLDGHAGRTLGEIGDALQGRRDILTVSDIGTKRADRPPRLDHVRAGEIDRRLELRPHFWRQRAGFSLSGLQLHQDRCESLRKVVVNVAREPVAFLEDRLAALFQPALFGQAALVQRERCMTRNRLAEDDTPPLRAAVRGV